MKSTKIVFIVVFALAIMVCSGFVAAFTDNQASAEAFFSSPQLYRSQTAFVRVSFQSNTSEALQIWRIGIQFDWMNETEFIGTTYTTDMPSVEGHGSFVSDPIQFIVPYNITVGAHNYVIGVDGYDSTGGTFQWTSSSISYQITNPTSTSPTPTSSSNDDGGGGSFSIDLRMVVAGIAVAAIVIATLILVLEMLKRRPKRAKPASQPKPEAQSPPTASPTVPATTKPVAQPTVQPTAEKPTESAEKKPESKEEENKSEDYNI